MDKIMLENCLISITLYMIHAIKNVINLRLDKFPLRPLSFTRAVYPLTEIISV